MAFKDCPCGGLNNLMVGFGLGTTFFGLAIGLIVGAALVEGYYKAILDSPARRDAWGQMVEAKKILDSDGK